LYESPSWSPIAIPRRIVMGPGLYPTRTRVSYITTQFGEGFIREGAYPEKKLGRKRGGRVLNATSRWVCVFLIIVSSISHSSIADNNYVLRACGCRIFSLMDSAIVFQQVFPGIPCTRGVQLEERRRHGERRESNAPFLTLLNLMFFVLVLKIKFIYLFIWGDN